MGNFKSFREWLSLREDATASMGNPGRIDPQAMAQMDNVIKAANVDPFDAASGDVEASKKIAATAVQKGVPIGTAAEVMRPAQVNAKQKADASKMSVQKVKTMRKR